MTPEGIGVILAVHSAEVARNAKLHAQAGGEVIAPHEAEAAPCVRLVGRGELLCGTSPFGAEIEDTGVAAQVNTLRERGLVGAGIDREGQVQRRTATLRMDAHHTASEVAVLRRRNARNDFHRLDVIHSDTARVDAAHRAEVSIATEPHAIHLDCR